MYSLGPPLSSSNKTDTHDLADILLKVALNTIKPTKTEPNNYSGIVCPLNYGFWLGIFKLFLKKRGKPTQHPS
jgi:hypothetical protein